MLYCMCKLVKTYKSKSLVRFLCSEIIAIISHLDRYVYKGYNVLNSNNLFLMLSFSLES